MRDGFRVTAFIDLPSPLSLLPSPFPYFHLNKPYKPRNEQKYSYNSSFSFLFKTHSFPFSHFPSPFSIFHSQLTTHTKKNNLKIKKMIPYYIFTGGPGSGKSSVLEALAQAGYTIVPEVGRAIIKQQIEQKGDALPWLNKQLFFEQMFTESLADYHKQSNEVLTFFDRGLLDSIGYALLENLTIHPHHWDVAQETHYAPLVFIFPPWEAIYQKDTERKQDFELAQRTYESMLVTYKKMGYQLLEVPLTSIEKRVEFILHTLHINQ